MIKIEAGELTEYGYAHDSDIQSLQIGQGVMFFDQEFVVTDKSSKGVVADSTTKSGSKEKGQHNRLFLTKTQAIRVVGSGYKGRQC